MQNSFTSFVVRLRAATATRDAAVTSAMRRGLASSDRFVRAESADALAMLGDTRGLLLALACGDAYVRQRAVKGLASERGLRVALRLAARSRDAATEVRAAVAEAFGRRGGTLARVALRQLAADADPLVRHAALRALAEINPRAASNLLERARRSDPHPWVRDSAGALLRRTRARPADVS